MFFNAKFILTSIMLSAKMFVRAGYAYLEIAFTGHVKRGISMELIENVSLLGLGIGSRLYFKAIWST